MRCNDALLQPNANKFNKRTIPPLPPSSVRNACNNLHFGIRFARGLHRKSNYTTDAFCTFPSSVSRPQKSQHFSAKAASVIASGQADAIPSFDTLRTDRSSKTVCERYRPSHHHRAQAVKSATGSTPALFFSVHSPAATANYDRDYDRVEAIKKR